MMRPDFIDCHAHVNFSAFDADRDDVLRRTIKHKTWMVNVGTKQETSLSAVELTKGREGVYAIVGLHPVHVNVSFHDKEELGGEGKPFTSKGEDFDKDFYKKLASDPKVVGIGECGLDFYREQGAEELKRQETAFRGQIELALETGKPLMLHVRNAYKEALAILKEYKKDAGEKLKGNFHFFAGTEDIASEILDLGFGMSFTGVITFPPRLAERSRGEAGAKDYEPLVRYVPLDRMLSETDCPYVAPVPYRGKRNEPLYVSEVVRAIATIRDENPEEVQKQLVENAFQLFSL